MLSNQTFANKCLSIYKNQVLLLMYPHVQLACARVIKKQSSSNTLLLNKCLEVLWQDLDRIYARGCF